MKYRWFTTGELLLWALLGVWLTLLMVPTAIAVPRPEMGLSGWGLAALLVGMVLLGMLLFIVGMWLMKHAPRWVKLLLSGTGLLVMWVVIGRLVALGVWYLQGRIPPQPDVVMLFALAILGAAVWGIGVAVLQRAMLQLSARLLTVAMLLAFAAMAATFGPMFSPLIIIALLVVISIYDMVAVWRMRTMQKMAKAYMQGGWFLGIMVPLPRPGKTVFKSIAFLGGGDVFFMGLVTASTWFWIPTGVIAVVLGMFAGLIGLMLIAEKNKSYPAMPFISAGACGALLVLSLI